MHDVMCVALGGKGTVVESKLSEQSPQSIAAYRKYCPPLFWKYYTIVDQRPDTCAYLIIEYLRAMANVEMNSLESRVVDQLFDYVFDNYTRFSDRDVISFIEVYLSNSTVDKDALDVEVAESIRSIFLTRKSILRRYSLGVVQRAFQTNEGDIFSELTIPEINQIESNLVKDFGLNWLDVQLNYNRRLLEIVFRNSDWERFKSLDLYLMTFYK